MDTQAVLKAGGVGAAVAVLLTLLGYIPCVGCITFFLSLDAHVGIGILAVHWMRPPRTAGSGAINGAAAAVVAVLISGIINIAVSTFIFTISGTSPIEQTLANMPPEQLTALRETGIDPTLFANTAGILGISAACCTIGLVIAAALGAAGGAFWGSRHPA